MRLLLALALAPLSCAARSPAPATPVGDLAAYRAGAAALVRVVTVDPSDGGRLEGSGAALAERAPDGSQLVLTAGHLFEGGVPVAVVETTEDTASGHHEMVGAMLVARDPVEDLALLELSRPVPARGLRLAAREPATFSRVYLFGNPEGAPRTVGPGVISAKHRPSTKRPHDLWQITGFAWPGSSGGPVLDAAGELVSVVLSVDLAQDDESAEDGKLVVVPEVSFGAPWGAVRRFMEKWRRGR